MKARLRRPGVTLTVLQQIPHAEELTLVMRPRFEYKPDYKSTRAGLRIFLLTKIPLPLPAPESPVPGSKVNPSEGRKAWTFLRRV